MHSTTSAGSGGGYEVTVEYFDAYIQPSSQLGSSGDVSVLVGTERVATTQFHTWLVP